MVFKTILFPCMTCYTTHPIISVRIRYDIELIRDVFHPSYQNIRAMIRISLFVPYSSIGLIRHEVYQIFIAHRLSPIKTHVF